MTSHYKAIILEAFSNFTLCSRVISMENPVVQTKFLGVLSKEVFSFIK